MKKILVFGLCVFALTNTSCNSNAFKEVPENQFLGTWKVEERGILDGLVFEIKYNDKHKLKGKVIALGRNKFQQLFTEIGDPFIKEIERYSNTEFKLTEKKIAAPLFSSYGLSTNTKLDVHFHHIDTIYIGEKGNRGKYIRIIK